MRNNPILRDLIMIYVIITLYKGKFYSTQSDSDTTEINATIEKIFSQYSPKNNIMFFFVDSENKTPGYQSFFLEELAKNYSFLHFRGDSALEDCLNVIEPTKDNNSLVVVGDSQTHFTFSQKYKNNYAALASTLDSIKQIPAKIEVCLTKEITIPADSTVINTAANTNQTYTFAQIHDFFKPTTSPTQQAPLTPSEKKARKILVPFAGKMAIIDANNKIIEFYPLTGTTPTATIKLANPANPSAPIAGERLRAFVIQDSEKKKTNYLCIVCTEYIFIINADTEKFTNFKLCGNVLDYSEKRNSRASITPEKTSSEECSDVFVIDQDRFILGGTQHVAKCLIEKDGLQRKREYFDKYVFDQIFSLANVPGSKTQKFYACAQIKDNFALYLCSPEKNNNIYNNLMIFGENNIPIAMHAIEHDKGHYLVMITKDHNLLIVNTDNDKSTKIIATNPLPETEKLLQLAPIPNEPNKFLILLAGKHGLYQLTLPENNKSAAELKHFYYFDTSTVCHVSPIAADSIYYVRTDKGLWETTKLSSLAPRPASLTYTK